jgi:hypothetical protein
LSRFVNLHPGGKSVLFAPDIGKHLYGHLIPYALLNFSPKAGQDATEAFYGLHRHEVLQKPNYQRLQIGTIIGESPRLSDGVIGEPSKVPYAEPTWLSSAYHSPYYTKVFFSLLNSVARR